MNRRILAFSFVAALSVSPALAQDWTTDDQGSIVLVSPEGELLDYVPDASDVIVKRNNRGERVLIDHYGNLVATEISARSFLRDRENLRRLPGIEEISPRREVFANRDRLEDADMFPPRPRSDDGYGVVTGTIPREEDADRRTYSDQALPGDGTESNEVQQDMAALDPAPSETEQKPADPVITLDGNKSTFEITALQVFLDREGASPGVIDGKMGSNVSKAIIAYERISGETLDPNDSEAILTRLGLNGGLPVMEYTITSADAAGPYVASIPEDYAHKAALPSMAYTSVTEALAERFHMDETYLKQLNPGVDFTFPGTVIKVINPGTPKKGVVARIIADKARKQLFAYDADGGLVTAYPASIGSSDTPSPSGIHTVERVALDPNYTYNPKINFQQGENTKVLTIPPGPNGPVGSVWIALSKPTYGIHGTPDPSRIGRTQSHGCIRLTNWDATELAKMVSPGVTVEFID